MKYKIMDSEQGFAAIIVAIVFIIVLSLTTVGFAQLMRNEQQSALNKQLSTQAFDAAESGVNAAAAAINAGYTSAKTSCTGGIDNTQPPAAISYLEDNTVGGQQSSTNASYPCLLINPTPSQLEYQSIDTVNPTVVEVEGINPANSQPENVQGIEISWQNALGGDSFLSRFRSCSTFYPANSVSGATWTYTGLLRAQLISLNDLSRNGLINNEYTSFLCPSSLPNNVDSYSGNSGTNSGDLVNGDCSFSATPKYCNVQIDNLGGLNESTFAIVLKSIYIPTQATITLYGGSGGPSTFTAANQLEIGDGQYVVDSTGKAENVLRRIQVRIPAVNNYYYPPGGGASICKQLQITPSSGTSGACTIPSS